MADPYTSPTLSGFNANPPSDTGRAGGASNIVTWQFHISKIGDPLRVFAQAVDTNVAAAFAKVLGGAGVREIDISSGNQSVIMSDQGKLVMVTTGGANNVVLPDPASVGVPFVIAVGNSTSTPATVSTSAGTINGLSTITLQQHEAVVIFSDGTDWWLATTVPSLSSPLPRGYMDGFRLENAGQGSPPDGSSVDDLVFAGGACRDDTNTANIATETEIIKELDSVWALGDNNGGLDNGSVSANTWYSCWRIKRSDTGVVDALFSTSATSPSMPTNYDLKRRVGWIRTGSVGSPAAPDIRQFKQYPGGEFRYLTPPALDVDETVGTTAELHTLSAPPNTWAIINVAVIGGDTEDVLYISPIDTVDLAASITASPLASGGVSTHTTSGIIDISRHFFERRVRVDASSQVRLRATGNVTVRIATVGWTDDRGKDV